MIKLLKKLPKGHRQFVKFCIVGTISLFVNMLAYAILTRFAHLYYLVADISAYTIALIGSYAMNKTFTFKNKQKKIAAQFTKYAGVYLIGMVLSASLLYVFVNNLGLYDLSAKILIIGIITIWNFFGSKFLIFDRDEKKAPQADRYFLSN